MPSQLGARNVVAILLVLAIATLITAQTMRTLHVVREHQTITQMLWNQNEAYIVSGVRRDGRSGSVTDIGRQVVRGLFGAAFQFTESRHLVIVSRLADGAINQAVDDGQLFRFIEPFEGAIYSQSNPLLTWNGQHFVPATAEAANRFRTAKRDTDPNYSNDDDWSSRVNLLNQGNQRFAYLLKLKGGPAEVIADRSNFDFPRITAQFDGRELIEILAVDENFKFVSAAEYDRLMRQPLKP